MPRFLALDVNAFARFVEPFHLRLDRRGLVLVEGENRDSGDAFDSNGAGKSMLFEALTWAITGKMARYGDERIGGDQVCYGENPADVEITFQNARGIFKAHRARQRRGSPSLDIIVSQDGNWLPFEGLGVDASLATDDLAKLVGFEHRTLRNAIFLQGTGLDVASSTYTQQVKLLESVLRFDELTRARTVAADRAKALELQAREHLTAMESWSRQAETAQNTIQELEALDESERERELIQMIRDARMRAQSYAALDRREYARALETARNDRSRCEAELRHARTRLFEVQSLGDAATCRICNQPLDDVQREKLLSDATDAVSVAQLAFDQTSQAFVTRQAMLNELDRQIKVGDDVREQLRNDERELQDIRDRATRRLGIVQTQTEKLREAEQQLATLTEQVADARRTLSIAFGWSKRGFDELKVEILGAAAPVLNEAADRYANILTDDALRVEFSTLRESRSEDLLRLRRGQDACVYESLSNGERRRVDLVVALALRACARWRISEPINLSVWDEVFDKLDESGLRRAVEVLQQDLNELETVFVVTHNPTLRALFPGANVLRVIREHGRSHVEQGEAESLPSRRIRV